MTGNKTFDVIYGYVVLYVIGVVLSFVSEVTYKHRKVKDVLSDYKSIIAKFSMIYAVFFAFGIVYHVLGIKFKE